MTWEVRLAPEFEPEFMQLSAAVQTELLAHAQLLSQLNGSKHANMKELRFDADDGVWRVAFAFDIVREAILLVAGDKSGSSEARFYRGLIKKGDSRFDAHLTRLEAASKVRDKAKAKRGSRRR